MKLRIYLITSFAFLFVVNAMALPQQRMYRDVKLPTQKVLEYQIVTTPVVAATARILSGQATSASVITTVTSFLAQPDVPRNLTITPGGTTADVPAGDVVVTGTNVWGQTITENFTFLANASTVTTGNKAFKTVTSIVFPIQDGASATYSVGIGSKLGLVHCTKNAGGLAWSIFDGAFETTRGTMGSDSSHVESNTFTPNGTMNGAKTVEVVYIQNYGCNP